mmetsp:Transcript_24707/g.25339  ORF Transcript_24707/g.25339 Transcript_24707/m.25339 type:complete len:80 (+) Transcript_24707:46-285(+)
MAETTFEQLKDFDWSLRLVLSSDKLSGLRKPLLMLNLETIDCNGVNHNQLIELTSEELKPFIEKLKSAQRVAHSVSRNS